MAKRDETSPANPLSHAALLREVTSLRETLELLRDQNEELVQTQGLVERSRDDIAEYYDLAPQPLFALSASGTITCVNTAAEELLEQPRIGLLGHLLLRFVHPLDRSSVRQRVLTNPASYVERCEARILLPSNEAVPVQLRARRSSRKAGVLHVTLLDLRERERETQEKQQLIEAERRARAASDSKDQFIAMLSHELRTPLTPVLAAASTLCSAPELDSEVRELFEMIQRNVAAEARLIDDLLDATGIVRGKLRVERQPLELHGLLQECVQAVQERARLKGVNLIYESKPGACHVLGDGLRIRQVFSNLLSNALKFTPAGGEVEVRSWDREGGIVVEVRDTGIGFDPAQAPRLFAAFEQLDRTKTATGGLGLGLAISKGLVELHGGKITAASPGIGRGARFVVELPSHPEFQAIAPPAVERRVPTESAIVPRYRILLVEDHADTAEIMASLLEEQGYRVVASDSVEAALNVDLDGIDLVVSDIGLPDGSGIELMRQLRRTREVPAIALSGYGMDSDVENSRQAGFDLHLTKPVAFNKLLGAVRSLLAGQRPRYSIKVG